MTNQIIMKIADAICERRNANDWPCNGLDFDEEMAKIALNAARDLVKCTPEGVREDHIILNHYIDKALK